MTFALRHCEKLHKNGGRVPGIPSCPWDPPLVRPHHDFYLKSLVRTLPQVRRIISSPFLRCRQTVNLVVKYLHEFYGNYHIDIIYDPLLREFLGNWKGKRIYVEPETERYMNGCALVELDGVESVRKRMKEFKSKYILTDSDCIVSHQLCIKELARLSSNEQNIELTSPGIMYISQKEKHLFEFITCHNLYSALQTAGLLPKLRAFGLKAFKDNEYYIGDEKYRNISKYNFILFETNDINNFIQELGEKIPHIYCDMIKDSNFLRYIIA